VLPVLEKVTAHILRDEKLAGLRVAVIGDFHLAPWRSINALRYAIDVINANNPDLVALVGDYGHSVELIPPLSRVLYSAVMPQVVRELARLRPHHGVFAVLGNHDVDADADSVTQSLRDAAVHVLRDGIVDVPHLGGVVRIVGLNDLTRDRRSNLPLSAITSADADVTLVLSHHPDFVHRNFAALPFPAVVLAGHTHGGQIAFPFWGAPVTLSKVTSRRFPAGFVPNAQMALYVTRGLGEQLPLRLRAKREITILELARR
jgi:predicted MPP superfamily phosphohydrolase